MRQIVWSGAGYRPPQNLKMAYPTPHTHNGIGIVPEAIPPGKGVGLHCCVT